MRRTLSNAVIIILILISISGLTYMAIDLGKMYVCDSLDAKAREYDYSGGFILIDAQEGLMGIYSAHTPLTHVWSERLRVIKPGRYRYASVGDLIELTKEDSDHIIHLYMMEKDFECIKENVANDTVVMVI
jgi:hypothetical protein